jgi:hypothetical protein
MSDDAHTVRIGVSLLRAGRCPMSAPKVVAVWLLLIVATLAASFIAPERQRPYWYGVWTGLMLGFVFVRIASFTPGHP